MLENLGITHSWPSVYEILLFLQFLLIYGADSADSPNCGSCRTVVFAIEKKSAHKWTHTVQTCVVQRTTTICKAEYYATVRKAEETV